MGLARAYLYLSRDFRRDPPVGESNAAVPATTHSADEAASLSDKQSEESHGRGHDPSKFRGYNHIYLHATLSPLTVLQHVRIPSKLRAAHYRGEADRSNRVRNGGIYGLLQEASTPPMGDRADDSEQSHADREERVERDRHVYIIALLLLIVSHYSM